jgi:hypothetical protein
MSYLQWARVEISKPIHDYQKFKRKRKIEQPSDPSKPDFPQQLGVNSWVRNKTYNMQELELLHHSLLQTVYIVSG